jgi:hypothetical protein
MTMTKRERVRLSVAAAGLFGGVGIAIVIMFVMGGASIWEATLTVVASYVTAAVLVMLIFVLISWAMKP